MKKPILFYVLFIFLFAACNKDDFKTTPDSHIKIAVISDLHYMHPSLIKNNATNGTAFKTDLLMNPNKAMLAYSAPILQKTIDELLAEKPDVVLIAGDMVKDGELVSHQDVAANYLYKLTSAGIKVYLVPGNNDINNEDAYGYDGNNRYEVPNINPQEFKSIYANFGYNNFDGSIKERDWNSLIYLAQPFPDLYILAIDANKYDPEYERGGVIKPETMEWIQEQLAAIPASATVLGLMHHNVVEHFQGQTIIMKNTVTNEPDWKPTANALTEAGLKVMLTGHNHATDITAHTYNGKTLYAVQTGSLITPPSPYRILTLKNKELSIDTKYITSISSTMPENVSFTEYSSLLLSSLLDKYFQIGLSSSPFNLSAELAKSTAPLARNAYMAHMAGDEKLSPSEQAKIEALNQLDPKPTVAIWAINTLWTDLNTKDTKWHIKLTNP